MKTLNQVRVIGYIGQDPEIKEIGDFKLANLWVATHEQWKDKDGVKNLHTDWHKIVVLNPGILSFVQSYLKKGDHVYLEGHLKTRSWENQKGERSFMTEVIISGREGKLLLLNSKINEKQEVEKLQVDEDKVLQLEAIA